MQRRKAGVSQLIMMRHGESVWNAKNRFTGWVDLPLSQKGVEEALEGGRKIAEIPIDCVFTSTLIRAQMTAMLALLSHQSGKIPVIQHPEGGKIAEWGKVADPKALEETIPVYEAWQLNERMYGELQGLNKDETRKKFGIEQVHIWRRSYATPPPNGESLEMTAKRTLPYFWDYIVPQLAAGKNVFIAAHGNSLRAIRMELDHLSEEEVLSLEIPTGAPLIYSYQSQHFEAATFSST